ncbi:MlaA family lipoprotein, partial [uncultured Halovibrio sp.]|uniref:MlaA family lipoprotein n=1 Tax=uncultured Halovibrio sp. TaxID=985049 RepID=UPI0025EF9E13
MMHRRLIGFLAGVGIALNVGAQQDPEATDGSLPGNVDPQQVADSSVYDDRDPWESFNRSIFAFNEVVDGNLVRPV